MALVRFAATAGVRPPPPAQGPAFKAAIGAVKTMEETMAFWTIS
jgi:hypothetical protein